MTDTTRTTNGKRSPSFNAYFVQEREGSAWVPIGAAWDHADGNGFSLKLDLIPNVPGRIVLRRPKQKATEA